MTFSTMKCIILLCVCVILPDRSETDKVHPILHKELQQHLKNMKNIPWSWKMKTSHIEDVHPVSFDVKVVSTYKVKGMMNIMKGKYKDCAAILKKNPYTRNRDGAYVIYPDLKTKKNVYCDMTTEGGGWTVIQKRIDGSTDFYRDWKSYKIGFGNPLKNYWIGNEPLHLLTKSGNHALRVDLQKFNGQKAYAKYSKFSVGDESNKYKLTISGYRGTAGDGLGPHNGNKYSTKDQDNDTHRVNCATSNKAAWWYNACYTSNLNGQYANSAAVSTKYLNWRTWGNKYEALKRTSMMIRKL